MKIITFLIALLLLFFTSTSVSASTGYESSESSEDTEDISQIPITLNKDEIEGLVNLGFSEEEIENMTQEEFELNKSLKGEGTESDTKYFKVIANPDLNSLARIQDNNISDSIDIEITEEEFNKAINNSETEFSTFASNSKETSYKVMTTSATKLSSGKYRVKVSVDWKFKMPANRLTDVIGVGINDSLWEPSGGEYGKQTWKIFNTKKSTNSTGSATYTSSSNKWKYSSDMYTVKMNLKDNPSRTEKVTNIKTYMYYTVVPAKSLPSNLRAYGQYAHQENHVEISPAINFDGSGGFTISNSKKWSHQYVQTNLKTK